MIFSAAASESVDATLRSHLLQTRGQEDLCFALWRPSQGARRMTALLYRVILPRDGERDLHGNASFHPHFFQRALEEARRDGAGLAFLHSHLGPGWQGMSADDVETESTRAAQALAATSIPLLGLTLGTDGAWSARFWLKTAPGTYERRWCESVRVVGDRLRVTYADRVRPAPKPKIELTRTLSSWGPRVQSDLARLRVGVVGVGSVGCLVAEALARMGVEEIVLIDFDVVEHVNLDRLLHATTDDATRRERKVTMLAKALKRGATADRFNVTEVSESVTDETGYRAALDCDVLFSCVDRPWARSVMNHIALSHMIPVIDGGIAVSATKAGNLRGADWKAHTVAPGRRCLECLGQFDPGLVSVEKQGLLDDPAYIKGLPPLHAARRNENVFMFSLALASMELQQMLSMVVAPHGVSNIGQQTYHFTTGRLDNPTYLPCKGTCFAVTLIAQGDHSGIDVTGKHPAAEKLRRSTH